MTLLREAHRVARILALLSLLGGAGAVGLMGCDDGATTDPDTVEPEPTRGEPGITIFSAEPSTTQGFAPLELELDVLFRTGDPVADVEVEVDFGDGTELAVEPTRTSLTPNATDEELVTPEEREASLVHVYEEPGEYTVRVTVRDTSNVADGASHEDTETLTITVTEQPDLIATGVTASAQRVEIDEVFTVDFSVLNDGSDVTRGFFVRLMLVDDPQARLEDLADTSSWIELGLFPTPATGLARGTSLNLSEPVQICDPRGGAAACEALRAQLGEGMWYPAILVDPLNEARPALNLAEADETNNFRVSPSGLSVAPLADLPDLRPQGIVANPATTDVLNEISVTFEVTNVGEQDAPPTHYELFLSEGDATLDPTDLPLGEGEVPPVSVGGTQIVASLSFPLGESITLPGEFWVVVRADADGAVDERNETNNIAAGSRAITVTGAQQSEVDLVPGSLVVTPAQTYVNGQFQVDFAVTNVGADDPGTYQCALYLSPDDALDTDTDSLLALLGGENLPGGDSDTYTRVLYVSNFTSPGTYYVFVVCDPQNRVGERDETNNVVGPSTPLVVNAQPQIDYSVENLTVSAGPIAEQGDLTVTVDVCNNDIDAAGPVLVRAYYSPDSVIDPGDPLLQGKLTVTPGLAQGQCETVTLSGKVGCLPFVDVYTVGVIVDPTSGVTESDESNNRIAGPTDGLTVTGGQGSLCACAEDTLESGNDNGSQATASTITLSGSDPRTASLSPLALCNATDFYALTVNRGDTVALTLTYDASIAPLGVRFYDPTEMAPREVRDTGATGTLTLTEQVLGTSPQETVHIEVYPLTGGARNYYDLDLTVTAAAVEPELTVSDITLVTGTFPSILDAVVWDVTVSNSGLSSANNVQVTSWLSTNTTLDGADLEVGSQVIPTVATIDSETITFQYTFPPATPSGNYYVIARVDPLGAITEVNEANNDRTSARFTLDADCFEDAFEGTGGNETFATAYPLSPATGGLRTFDDLSVCNNGRVDVYLVCAPAGTPLNHVGILQPGASFQSASEVALFDRAETAIGTVATSTTLDVVSVAVPAGTCTTNAECVGGETCNASGFCADASGNHCVYARVSLRSTSTVIARPYSVIVDTGAANQLGEPTNDTRANAAEFSASTGSIAAGSGHTTSRNDVDWYYLDLEAGTQFTVHFETSDDDLRLVVYHPTANSIDAWKPETLTLTSNTRVEFSVTKVNSPGADRPSTYRIRLEGLEGIDLVPLEVDQDVTEVAAGGSVLLTWELTNERLDDTLAPVTYRYVVSTDTTLDPGDLEVDRATVAGPDALSAINVQEKVYMTLPPELFGDLTVFIEVDPANVILEVDETNNVAPVPLTVRQLCVADANEAGAGNQTIATATPIAAPFSAQDLTVCSNDADLYAVTVPAGATYQFSITDMVVWTYGDIDLFLLDGNGVQLARSDALDTPAESITWTNTSGASRTVYLQVLPFRGDYTNRYDLSVVAQ